MLITNLDCWCEILMFGVLNLNKPPGLTSRDVVNIVQRMAKPAKVGHAGTLDPMATGVLLVCVGPATRLISILQQASKTYVAEFRLGETSDTDDSTGTVVVTDADFPPVSREELDAALKQFEGAFDQVPPAFSAVKVKGQRAYAKARRGEDVQLSAKQVTVYSIDVLSYTWPVLSVKIVCGSGTYIRSIARDLGERLRCGGLMSALERTAIGEFCVIDALVTEDLTPENLSTHVTDAIQTVSHLSSYRCSADDLALVKTGRPITVRPVALETRGDYSEGDNTVALISHDAQQLLALGEFQNDGQHIQPRAVFCQVTNGNPKRKRGTQR